MIVFLGSIIGAVSTGIGIAGDIFGGSDGPTDAQREWARKLISQRAARPLQIPTMAANAINSGGNNFTVDELGGLYTKTPTGGAILAAAEIGCNPVPNGKTVRGIRYVAGDGGNAGIGQTFQIYQCGTQGGLQAQPTIGVTGGGDTAVANDSLTDKIARFIREQIGDVSTQAGQQFGAPVGESVARQLTPILLLTGIGIAGVVVVAVIASRKN